MGEGWRFWGDDGGDNESPRFTICINIMVISQISDDRDYLHVFACILWLRILLPLHDKHVYTKAHTLTHCWAKLASTPHCCRILLANTWTKQRVVLHNRWNWSHLGLEGIRAPVFFYYSIGFSEIWLTAVLLHSFGCGMPHLIREFLLFKTIS